MNMNDRLAAKIARARQRAEEERKAQQPKHSSTLPPEKFARDDHQVDGTVRPNPEPASGAATWAGLHPQRQWARHGFGGGWFDPADAKSNSYLTMDGQPPAADMANVATMCRYGAEVPLGIVPRHLVAERRLAEIDQAISEYTKAGHKIPIEWEAERLEIINAQADQDAGLPVHSAMQVLKRAVQTDPDYARSWRQKLRLGFKDAALKAYPESMFLDVLCKAVSILAADQMMRDIFEISPESELFKSPGRIDWKQRARNIFLNGAEMAKWWDKHGTAAPLIYKSDEHQPALVNEEAAAVAASPALQAKLTMEQLRHMGHPEGTIITHEAGLHPPHQHYDFWGLLPGGGRIYRPKR